MTKSKFNSRTFRLSAIVVVMVGILLLIITSAFISDGSMPPLAPLLFKIIFFIFWIVVIFGELRTKVVSITIDDNSITTKNYMGLGKGTRYDFKNLQGFKISTNPSHRVNSECLYLLLNYKKVIKISENYHKNYPDLKLIIASKTKNLGFESFKWINEFKEYFI